MRIQVAVVPPLLLVTVAMFAVLLSRAAAQQTTAADGLIRDLHSDKWRVVNAAATAIITMPPANRTPPMIAALVAEYDRFKGMYVPARERETDCGFHCELLDLAVKADDPALIPFLAKGVDIGSNVIDALVKRGNAAVPMLAAELQRRHDPSYTSSAFIGFRRMLDRGVRLSGSSRSTIADLAREQLSSRYSLLIEAGIQVAVELRDRSLVPRLKELAEARTMAAAKLDLLRPSDFSRLSRMAAEALTKIPR